MRSRDFSWRGNNAGISSLSSVIQQYSNNIRHYWEKHYVALAKGQEMEHIAQLALNHWVIQYSAEEILLKVNNTIYRLDFVNHINLFLLIQEFLSEQNESLKNLTFVLWT